ncbi:2-oxo acid dehydrogenase subunit E2 [Microtetraspora sp. AC03309]|uniref:2-oxo acid dehydrogenase subunit E2 n=1 Tax=Microtetraspora sp. AC03309 TaxID=2779376 RepID=UPI001E28A32A|nr:2-oxo acid dehydrogenase subunit E2 [Microtetraspora sp. AC03309]MCC5575156.1 2-oxo acid dehydrogenase subunit E2 [Microtetraspora sp. AC03309]
MTDIRVPKLNSNDTAYVLVEWLVADGQRAEAGDPIVLLETSKATEELVAEEDGFVWRELPVNADCPPGALIARITTGGERPSATPPGTADCGSAPGMGAASKVSSTSGTGSASGAGSASRTGTAATGVAATETAGTGAAETGAAETGAASGGGPSHEPLITVPAQELIDELGIDPEEVRALGVPVVRTADVERLVAGRMAPPDPASGVAPSDPASGVAGVPYALSRVQRAVARAVRSSHETIPAAYTVMKIDVGAGLEMAAQLTREIRRPVGLPELVTCAVARLHATFPLFYATIVDENSAMMAEAPHIGVTIDTGAGLYVPVIHDAAGRSVRDVANRLMEYRLAAVTGDFRESDLTGANIVVTLHHDGDVTLAIPLIFPGHVCALAVTAPQAVLRLEAGEVVSRTVADIGLAYDHRLINGRDAALFLRALKALLEAPEEVVRRSS